VIEYEKSQTGDVSCRSAGDLYRSGQCNANN